MVDEVRRQSKSRQEFRSRLAGGRVETESRRGDGGGVARGGKESLFSGRPLPEVCPPGPRKSGGMLIVGVSPVKFGFWRLGCERRNG